MTRLWYPPAPIRARRWNSLLILGGVSYTRLSVAQYPEIAPPVINITGQYPGASAETVADTVAPVPLPRHERETDHPRGEEQDREERVDAEPEVARGRPDDDR